MPVDVSDGIGWTALHTASMSNRTDVIKHLLHEGANMNIQNRWEDTPLHRAVRRKSTDAARILIENGANVNLLNDYDKTPLDLADIGSEVERLLLQVQQSAP